MFHTVLSTQETVLAWAPLQNCSFCCNKCICCFFILWHCLHGTSLLHKTLEIFDEMTMFSLVLLFTCLFTLMYSGFTLFG